MVGSDALSSVLSVVKGDIFSQPNCAHVGLASYNLKLLMRW